MTQGHPERDKVEEIQQRLLRVAVLGYVPPDDLHVIADAAEALSLSEKRAESQERDLAEFRANVPDLVLRVASAEKRAEEAERELARYKAFVCEGLLFRSETNDDPIEFARLCLEVHYENDRLIIAERDEARRFVQLFISERDSLRSSLARVVEECAAICDEEYNEQAHLATFHKGEGDYEAMDRRNAAARAISVVASRIRSALHRSQGE